ncbi:MAG: 16S rRNA (adenine(1518)-N(6)/adenine(1519)-N(6))-dimethyltransferase RsmA [Bacteroidota bacterium]
MSKCSPIAKKHWGQHFLQDPSICEEIVNLLGDTSSYGSVIEVGPGCGALTRFLIKNVSVPLYLVEVDKRMVTYLAQTYPMPEGQLIHQDFIDFSFDQVPQGDVALIGNLPYNMGSQILLHAVNHRKRVSKMVCMLQKEVAQRIASPPGHKRYGLLSVWLQAFYTISYDLEVPPAAFRPPPKVTSAVLRMDCYRTSLPCDENYFFHVVKTAFQQRRKILGNALSPLGVSLENLSEDLLKRRAEALSVEDFIFLTQGLSLASRR